MLYRSAALVESHKAPGAMLWACSFATWTVGGRGTSFCVVTKMTGQALSDVDGKQQPLFENRGLHVPSIIVRL